MTAQPPTLAHEIEAVAWAANHVEAMAKAARMRTGEVEEMRRRLEAALELHDDELGNWRPLAEAAEKVLATLEALEADEAQ